MRLGELAIFLPQKLHLTTHLLSSSTSFGINRRGQNEKWRFGFWLMTDLFGFGLGKKQIKGSRIKKRGCQTHLRGRWEEERLRLRGSKIQQIVKSLSARDEMGCSKRPMNFLFCVMLKLLSSFSQAVAVSMSMLTTGKPEHYYNSFIITMYFFYIDLFKCSFLWLNFFLLKVVADLGLGGFKLKFLGRARFWESGLC